MKRLIVLILFLGNIFAENIDKEAEKLETEKLEVEKPKKEKQLLKEEQIKVHSKEKNGFFLGVEAELGISSYLRYGEGEFYDFFDFIFDHKTTNVTFNGGLLFGYQHYFGKSEKHGIKISSHLYSGGGYFKNRTQAQDLLSGVTKDYYIKHSFIPIKFGLDIKYLWDFLEREKHLLGLNVGLGYGEEFYFHTIGSNYLIDDDFFYTNNTLVHDIYLTIGLHYLLKKHHLFEINYRFGGILGLNQKEQDINFHLDEFGWDGILGKYRLNTQSYFTFSYAYKF